MANVGQRLVDRFGVAAGNGGVVDQCIEFAVFAGDAVRGGLADPPGDGLDP